MKDDVETPPPPYEGEEARWVRGAREPNRPCKYYVDKPVSFINRTDHCVHTVFKEGRMKIA